MVILTIHLIALLIGYACHSAFGIGIIFVAAILFIIFMCGVDYPIYQEKWILYGIGTAGAVIFNGIVVGWIVLYILVVAWRYKDGQKWA